MLHRWSFEGYLKEYGYRGIVNQCIKEVLAFDLIPDFCGGRFQTTIQHVFAHVRPDRTLGKVEINKPGGTVYYLKP